MAPLFVNKAFNWLCLISFEFCSWKKKGNPVTLLPHKASWVFES